MVVNDLVIVRRDTDVAAVGLAATSVALVGEGVVFAVREEHVVALFTELDGSLVGVLDFVV